LSANSIAVAQEQVTEEWRKRGAEMFRKNIVEGWNKLSKEEQRKKREEKRKKREEKGKRKRGAEVSAHIICRCLVFCHLSISYLSLFVVGRFRGGGEDGG
jgi:hypothetical protein